MFNIYLKQIPSNFRILANVPVWFPSQAFLCMCVRADSFFDMAR